MGEHFFSTNLLFLISYSTSLTNMPLFTTFLKLLPLLSILIPKIAANPRLLSGSPQHSGYFPFLMNTNIPHRLLWWIPCSTPVFPFLCWLHRALPAACARQPCLHLCPGTPTALPLASRIASHISMFKPLCYEKICRLMPKANS